MFFGRLVPGGPGPLAMSLELPCHPRDRGVGVMLSLHQHGREKDVFAHDGGNIALLGRRLGLAVCQLAQDKEDGDREQ